MSHLLSRISKPFVYKNVLRHNNIVQWCSSGPMYPFMLIDHILKVGDSSDGRVERGDEAMGEKEVIIKDKELADEVRDAMNIKFIQRRPDIYMADKTSDNVRLFMNYTKEQKLEHIKFPPLPKGSQIQNIAMSCCPRDLEDEDWIMAVKYSGSKLKLYRHKEPQWIDIETTHESISPYSSLMYSKKDQRFYVLTPGSNYLCSFGLNFKEKDKPDFVELRTINLPDDVYNSDSYQLDATSTLTRTDHMVESPSGEQFLISWYYEDDYQLYKGLLTIIQKTNKFVVFREDEQLTEKERKFMSLTEDIGDLCIFLGRDEGFCVRASSSPGLKPNCIYFVGPNYGVYDITTKTCHLFSAKEGRLISNEFPYWPHPFSLIPN